VFTLGLRNTVAYAEEEYNFEVDPNYPILGLLRNIFRAQRTFARDYVVYGQMQRPTPLEVRHVQADGFRGEPWEVMIPCVYHGVWRASDGRIGTVLANWSDQDEEVILSLNDASGPVSFVTNDGITRLADEAAPSAEVQVRVPARDVVLVEQHP
jgi:hypothetical protein